MGPVGPVVQCHLALLHPKFTNILGKGDEQFYGRADADNYPVSFVASVTLWSLQKLKRNENKYTLFPKKKCYMATIVTFTIQTLLDRF